MPTDPASSSDVGLPYRVSARWDNGGYDVSCTQCGWDLLDVETLETAAHLIDLHVGDEHFDA